MLRLNNAQPAIVPGQGQGVRRTKSLPYCDPGNEPWGMAFPTILLTEIIKESHPEHDEYEVVSWIDS